MPGILHYFGVHPEGKAQVARIRKELGKIVEVRRPFKYQNKTFTLYYSKECCSEYVTGGSRVWIVVGKLTAKKIKENSPSILMGYFDGSFLNCSRFPVDASIYLFLWDPQSPNEKGIDMPTE
jgi:hypothetical protein